MTGTATTCAERELRTPRGISRACDVRRSRLVRERRVESFEQLERVHVAVSDDGIPAGPGRGATREAGAQQVASSHRRADVGARRRAGVRLSSREAAAGDTRNVELV